MLSLCSEMGLPGITLNIEAQWLATKLMLPLEPTGSLLFRNVFPERYVPSGMPGYAYTSPS